MTSALGRMCKSATDNKTPALKQLAKFIALAPVWKFEVKNGSVENVKLYKNIAHAVQILTTEPVSICINGPPFFKIYDKFWIEIRISQK